MIALLRIIFFPLFKLLFEPELSCLHNPPSTTSYPPCPRCGSYHSIKNGSVHNGKPKRICKDCNRQFVINPTKKTVPPPSVWLIIAPELFFQRGCVSAINVVHNNFFKLLSSVGNSVLSRRRCGDGIATSSITDM